MGRLTQSGVVSTTPSSTLTRTSAFEYDPVTGLLSAEIIEPGDPNLELRTEYGYTNADGNNYGLKTSVTAKGLGGTYPITARTSTTTYDFSALATGIYTVTDSNARGHTETKVINARLGTTLSLKGPNGLITSWDYDLFGRLKTEYRADGTRTDTSHAWCNGGGCPQLAVRSVTTTATVAPPVTQYLDLLSRVIGTETIGFTGQTILADTTYNARGEVSAVSRNYFSGNKSYWTSSEYDVLGRIIKVVSPDGGVVSSRYNGLDTIVTKSDLNSAYTDQVITQM